MRHLLLPLLLLLPLGAGCGLESDAFVIGPPEVPSVRLTATLDTAAVAQGGCAPAPDGSDAIQPVAGGCRMGVHLGGLPLLDPHTSEAAAQRLEGRSLDAIRPVTLVVRSVTLSDGEAPVSLGDLGARVRLSVDDVDLLGELEPARIEAGPVRVVVPEGLRMTFADALVRGRPLVAPVAVELEVPAGALADLPDRLGVEVVLQPEAQVTPSDPAAPYLGG